MMTLSDDQSARLRQPAQRSVHVVATMHSGVCTFVATMHVALVRIARVRAVNAGTAPEQRRNSVTAQVEGLLKGFLSPLGPLGRLRLLMARIVNVQGVCVVTVVL
jgi:hypothetical protein